MKVIQSIAQLKSELSKLPRILVPTMGALHSGHGELIRVARTIANTSGEVIVSVFVNPLQFGANEDFSKYPRTYEQDIKTAQEYGADVIWFPSAEELLSDELIRLISPEFGNTLEGKFRPGHFDGVLTIVNRLFELVQPTHAIFGVKDLQQLILVREMTIEKWPNLAIVPVETIRDESGLALSSRNKYLSSTELVLAAEINKALNRAALNPDPETSFKKLLFSVGIQEAAIDYAIRLKMPNHCEDLGKERLVVAVRIGTTRLLDNIALN